MPAISPARLKIQTAQLAKVFSEPVAFVRYLHLIFDQYADRTYRHGQSGEPLPLILAYRVKPPVLKQILMELSPLTTAEPQQALALCDALWEQPYLEFRLLAASLLGQIPPVPPEPIISRIQAWIQKGTDAKLIDAMITKGTIRLKQENLPIVIRLAENCLSSKDRHLQKIGLQLLLTVIQDPRVENLPPIFTLIQPLVRSSHHDLRPELIDILQAFAQRSPKETAFFLQQTIDLPNSPDAPWNTRQVLSKFPLDLQSNLRIILREKSLEIK